MSVLNVAPIREAIREAAGAAWSVVKVHYGVPRLEQTELPYCVVYLESVPMEQVTATDVEQEYNFEIIYVGKVTTGMIIEDEKVERANELITELMTSSAFAGIGMLPVIRDVRFDETDDANEPVYEVSVTFSVIVHETALRR